MHFSSDCQTVCIIIYMLDGTANILLHLPVFDISGESGSSVRDCL